MKSKLITALITPFYEHGINYETLALLIDKQIAANVDGIVILGTTGEAMTITPSERAELIRFCVFYIDKRIELMVGCGSNDTSVAVKYAMEAYKLGADSILAVTPYYNKCNDDGIYCHYKAIAESTPLPIYIYNVPSRTGYDISINAVEKISQLLNIKGIKEAGGNLSKIVKMSEIDNFEILSGDDALTLPILAIGGKGVVSVVSNISPHLMRNMLDSYDNRQISFSQQYNKKVNMLSDALFSDVNPMPIKFALNMYGMNAGNSRLPLTVSDKKTQEKLRNISYLFDL